MRRVGKRVEPAVEVKTSGASLASNIAFSADMTRLAGGRVFFPKGVYRYKSHEEANAHQSEVWLSSRRSVTMAIRKAVPVEWQTTVRQAITLVLFVGLLRATDSVATSEHVCATKL